MNKKSLVLNHLKSGKTLTKFQAFNKFLITNLGDTILQLRKSYNIQTEMKKNKTTNTVYAVYKLNLKLK